MFATFYTLTARRAPLRRPPPSLKLKLHSSAAAWFAGELPGSQIVKDDTRSCESLFISHGVGFFYWRHTEVKSTVRLINYWAFADIFFAPYTWAAMSGFSSDLVTLWFIALRHALLPTAAAAARRALLTPLVLLVGSLLQCREKWIRSCLSVMIIIMLWGCSSLGDIQGNKNG